MLPGATEQVNAASQLHQFGYPIPGSHERFDPLEAGHARQTIGLPRHPGYLLQLVLGMQRETLASTGSIQRLPYASEIVPDIGQAVRCQGHQPWPGTQKILQSLFHIAQADGADVAQSLREYQLGLQVLQQHRINLVQG